MTAAQMDLHEASNGSTAPSGSARVLDSTVPGPGWDIQVAGPQDQPRVLAALTLAFSTDPANRWMYPSPESYLRHFPEFVMALGGRAFEVGSAYFIGDVQAAALWLPPSVGPDETTLMDLISRTLSNKKQEE